MMKRSLLFILTLLPFISFAQVPEFEPGKVVIDNHLGSVIYASSPLGLSYGKEKAEAAYLLSYSSWQGSQWYLVLQLPSSKRENSFLAKLGHVKYFNSDGSTTNFPLRSVDASSGKAIFDVPSSWLSQTSSKIVKRVELWDRLNSGKMALHVVVPRIPEFLRVKNCHNSITRKPL